MKQYKRVLSIAGSDSGGGAGIQADLKTFSALGCYGMTVITAVTAQNTLGVKGVWPMSVECVEKQLDAVLSDIGADAVKIGMLWSLELACVVADALKRHKVGNVVFDPVMVAQSGDNLMEFETSRDLAKTMAEVSSIVTPNIPEATFLLGFDISGQASMEKAVRELGDWGFAHVLLKGGHLTGDSSDDLLYDRESGNIRVLQGKRIETHNNHGTGCTLSSAIASSLAMGFDLQESCGRAKSFIASALEKGADYALGNGHGPVHHFHEFWS
jgi:hydroxymethylpyrimidine/phosphomethylpyrimidine kinase